MAAISKHTGDIGVWLERIADSCQTHQQAVSMFNWCTDLLYMQMITVEQYSKYSDLGFTRLTYEANGRSQQE